MHFLDCDTCVPTIPGYQTPLWTETESPTLEPTQSSNGRGDPSTPRDTNARVRVVAGVIVGLLSTVIAIVALLTATVLLVIYRKRERGKPQLQTEPEPQLIGDAIHNPVYSPAIQGTARDDTDNVVHPHDDTTLSNVPILLSDASAIHNPVYSPNIQGTARDDADNVIHPYIDTTLSNVPLMLSDAPDTTDNQHYAVLENTKPTDEPILTSGGYTEIGCSHVNHAAEYVKPFTVVQNHEYAEI